MLGSGMHACLSLCRADVWCSFELSGTPFRSFFTECIQNDQVHEPVYSFMGEAYYANYRTW